MTDKGLRVQFELIDEGDIAEYRGEPFTGIGLETFANGEIRCELAFVDGLQNGPAREWSESGRLVGETWYVDGIQHGVAREWNEDGSLRQRTTFDRGVTIEDVHFDSGGQVVTRFRMDPSSAEAELLALMAPAQSGVAPDGSPSVAPEAGAPSSAPRVNAGIGQTPEGDGGDGKDGQ